MFEVVADVETSGRQHWWHDVISCGLVVVDGDLNEVATFYDTVRPHNPDSFDDDTTAVHGFTKYDALQFQRPDQMALKILHFLKPFRKDLAYTPFVFHAVGYFDYNFMESFYLKCGLQFSWYKMFNRNHAISTIALGRAQGHGENGLAAWASRLGQNFQHHNSLDDARMAALVYKNLRSQPNAMQTETIATTPVKRKSRKKIADQPPETSQFALI